MGSCQRDGGFLRGLLGSLRLIAHVHHRPKTKYSERNINAYDMTREILCFHFHIKINFNISYCVCSDDPNIGWWPNCAAPIGGPFA